MNPYILHARGDCSCDAIDLLGVDERCANRTINLKPIRCSWPFRNVSPGAVAVAVSAHLAVLERGIARESARTMVVVTLLLSTVIGLSLGTLGAGGSILTMPVLTYVAGEPAASAIAMSLAVVCATSSIAAATYARQRRIRWSAALLFGPTGMLGAYAGGRLSALVSPEATLIAFAITMCVTAVTMLLRSRIPPTCAGPLSGWRTLAAGAGVGIVTGVLGVGGGFLVVPALVLIAGLSMEQAVGTSLVVIALQSGASLAGRLGHVVVDWQLTGAVAAVAVVGAVAGGRIGRRIEPARLQRAFAIFILAIAITMLGGELA